MLWQGRKSRGELNQGRERSENKIFGVRKREVRTKQWEIKKSKLKSPRSMPLKFTREAQRTGFGNMEHLMAPASLELPQSPSAAWDPGVNSRDVLFIFE